MLLDILFLEGKYIEVVWACIEKRRIRRQESDGDGGAGEKKEKNPEVIWKM